ncbi:hypothetical protein B0T26DRAFT_681860 [Lasiosphaeria miniovina]|uniref:Uncharacterized protein n=1 Tax=Lasiosphaeria miniovina TaxID=1954250 RepID=A0AA39ZQF2_9PEZI|nr:uncharacterized protein B0T26DRAFT_681860 [Lasiosphaeria miniovina]KAK0701746.1 hypothetical protein B0T26DRAFT_681860 [Lasiosphaeria miniovina]
MSSNTDNPKQGLITLVEAQKTKAPAGKKALWTKLVDHIKDPKYDLPPGQTMWTFGQDVVVGTSTEFINAYRLHNKGKQPKDFEHPAVFSHSTQVPQSAGNGPIVHPTRKLSNGDKSVPAAGETGQLAQWSSYNPQGAHHYIDVWMRIDPTLGGDPNIVFHYQPLNDTGSNVQTVYQADFNTLDAPLLAANGVGHLTFPGAITTANGQLAVTNTTLQLSVVAHTGIAANPWKVLMDWQDQLCVIMAAGPCLSGDIMRNHLFFCTSPNGARALYIADNKTTLLKNMPAQ